MILTIIQIILIAILVGFIIYWVGRIFAKGLFDEIEKRLMQKFNNKSKTKDDDRVQE
jgi:membrane protein DedA with SNARE-associated domain